jgi:acyl-CoA reductase-like NAD-dependent aldehyde dehydrogenase
VHRITLFSNLFVDFTLVAQRICWGKFSNAGQTCIAPDYVLVHEKVYDKLVQAIKDCIKRYHDVILAVLLG